MRDKLFSFFISQFGEATSQANVPDETVAKFQGVLPDQLLSYWKSEGWCGYRHGLFWTVNPDDYADVLDMWLEDTPFEEIDSYHVIARTAFGKLFAWGERTGPSLTVSCLDIVNYDVRLRDNYDGRRIDSPKLQLPLTCCLM